MYIYPYFKVPSAVRLSDGEVISAILYPILPALFLTHTSAVPTCRVMKAWVCSANVAPLNPGGHTKSGMEGCA